MAAKIIETEHINQLYNHYRAVFPHQIQCPGQELHACGLRFLNGVAFARRFSYSFLPKLKFSPT